MAVTHYRQLICWQKAMDLAEQVHLTTRHFPREELYGLTSQIRRAAVSVPSNIAEGQGRRTTGEFRQFLHIAVGSLQECETQLLLAGRFDYLDAARLDAHLNLAAEISRITHGLLSSLPPN